MTHPPPDPDLAALREEIRRAGRAVFKLRLGTAGCLSMPFVLAMIFGMVTRGYLELPEHSLLGLVIDVATCLLGITLAVGFGCAVALMDRRARRAVLKRRLAKLDRERRTEVLSPLGQGTPDDTFRLAQGLMRDFEIRTEVAPSAAPAGRGEEVTASVERG